MFNRMFRLQPGEVDVAMNGPKTTAYVIRSSTPTSSTLERGELFVATGINNPVLYPILRRESQVMFGRLVERTKNKYDLTWIREPQGDQRMSM